MQCVKKQRLFSALEGSAQRYVVYPVERRTYFVVLQGAPEHIDLQSIVKMSQLFRVSFDLSRFRVLFRMPLDSSEASRPSETVRAQKAQ